MIGVPWHLASQCPFVLFCSCSQTITQAIRIDPHQELPLFCDDKEVEKHTSAVSRETRVRSTASVAVHPCIRHLLSNAEHRGRCRIQRLRAVMPKQGRTTSLSLPCLCTDCPAKFTGSAPPRACSLSSSSSTDERAVGLVDEWTERAQDTMQDDVITLEQAQLSLGKALNSAAAVRQLFLRRRRKAQANVDGHKRSLLLNKEWFVFAD